MLRPQVVELMYTDVLFWPTKISWKRKEEKSYVKFETTIKGKEKPSESSRACVKSCHLFFFFDRLKVSGSVSHCSRPKKTKFFSDALISKDELSVRDCCGKVRPRRARPSRLGQICKDRNGLRKKKEKKKITVDFLRSTLGLVCYRPIPLLCLWPAPHPPPSLPSLSIPNYLLNKTFTTFSTRPVKLVTNSQL